MGVVCSTKMDLNEKLEEVWLIFLWGNLFTSFVLFACWGYMGGTLFMVGVKNLRETNRKSEGPVVRSPFRSPKWTCFLSACLSKARKSARKASIELGAIGWKERSTATWLQDPISECWKICSLTHRQFAGRSTGLAHSPAQWMSTTTGLVTTNMVWDKGYYVSGPGL